MRWKAEINIDRLTYRGKSRPTIGISLDWDGCGYVLLSLLDPQAFAHLERSGAVIVNRAVMRDAKATQPLYAENLMYNKRCQEVATQLVVELTQSVKAALGGSDQATVLLFVGSNRQSISFDKSVGRPDHHTKTHALQCFPDVAACLQKCFQDDIGREISVEFKDGLLSDDPLASSANSKEDFTRLCNAATYGSGIRDDRRVVKHPWLLEQRSKELEKDMKMRLNLYHMWKLHTEADGASTTFVFVDDRPEFTDNLVQHAKESVAGYAFPPNMTIETIAFDADDMFIDGRAVEPKRSRHSAHRAGGVSGSVDGEATASAVAQPPKRQRHG